MRDLQKPFSTILNILQIQEKNGTVSAFLLKTVINVVNSERSFNLPGPQIKTLHILNPTQDGTNGTFLPKLSLMSFRSP